MGLRGALRTLRRLLHATRRTASLAAITPTVRAFTPLSGATAIFLAGFPFGAFRTLRSHIPDFTHWGRLGHFTRLTRLTDFARFTALTGSARVTLTNPATTAIATAFTARLTAAGSLTAIITSPFLTATVIPTAIIPTTLWPTILTAIFARTIFRALWAAIAARPRSGRLGRSLTDVSIQLGQTAGMLVVGRLKQLRSLLVAHQRRGRQHGGWLSSLREQRGHFHLDGIDEHAPTNGRTRTHRSLETRNLDHGVARRRPGIEDDVGEVLQLAAVAALAATGLAMGLGNNGHDLHATTLEFLGHFDGHEVAARRGSHQSGVLGRKVVVAQDAGGQSMDVLQEHGLALAIGSHHEVVEAQRKFDDGVEPRKRAVAGPHFLHEDAAVSGAKTMHHPASQDGLCKEARSLRNGLLLGGGGVQKTAALVKIVSNHGMNPIRKSHRKWMPKIHHRSGHLGVASRDTTKPNYYHHPIS